MNHYVTAFNIIYGKQIQINTIEQDDMEGLVILESSMLTPEHLLAKKQIFNCLSNEAKEVVQLILNCPSEILELITTPQQNRITKTRIKRYFSQHWHSQFIVDETIKEIEAWVKKEL